MLCTCQLSDFSDSDIAALRHPSHSHDDADGDVLRPRTLFGASLWRVDQDECDDAQNGDNLFDAVRIRCV